MSTMRKRGFDDYVISAENQAKLEQHEREVFGLEEIPLYCPRCHALSDKVYSDATGHKSVKCWKCKYTFVTSLPYFRSETNEIYSHKKRDPRRSLPQVR